MIDEFPRQVILRNRMKIKLRIVAREDEFRLLQFFRSIPEAERNFLRYDITEAEALGGWFGGPNWNDVFALVAEVNGQIVGVGVLQGYRPLWARHVGEFWMMVAREVRGLGLGRLLANEMFALAAELGMEKLTAEVRADQINAIKIFGQLGYLHEGVLTNFIKDQDGQMHDLVILACDIQEYFRKFEFSSSKNLIETFG